MYLLFLVFPVIIEDERLNPENMYYFLWYAILLMIQTSLPRQSEETLRFLIPNLEFRRRIFASYDQDKIIQIPFPLLLASFSNDELYQYLTTKN